MPRPRPSFFLPCRFAFAALLATVVLCGLRAQSSAAETPDFARGAVYLDTNGNQQRDAGEKGIPGVRVSNQREVVKTDEQGHWQLPVDDDTTFFVIKPGGYRTAMDPKLNIPRFYYTHKPSGSPPVRYGGVAPTGPLPASIDFPLYPHPETDQFKVVFFGDTQPRDDKEIEYMAKSVLPELIGTDASFGVTLGDVVFDDLSIFGHHNQVVALIGIPWYNVLGNHDINYDAESDIHSDETWERVFGPNYYSFDYGTTHFIALDDVKWISATEAKRAHYAGALGDDQLEFVKNDLQYVPEDRLIVLMMHIPLPGLEDREKLYRLIEERPYSLSISGHTHYQTHTFITREDGWRGPKPHHHIVNVTVCGSWWTGAPDEYGIPHTMMRDGVPNGYSIMTFDNGQATFRYKAAGRPDDFQMTIQVPYDIALSKVKDTDVIVNVFAGSEKSTVEMRVSTGGSWLPLKQVTRKDPGFVALKNSEKKEPKLRGRPLPDPIQTEHIWVASLPAGIGKGVHLIQVRTTDMYGQTYQSSRVIRVQ